MEKELLVKFNGSQKIVALKESDDILKIIQEKFGIQQTHIILQNYDKEWDDWLDVSSFEEIPNRTVLRCVVPKLLSTETVVEVNKPDDTDILKLQSDSSTSSEEIIVGITSANLKAKWPDKFPIEEKNISEFKGGTKKEALGSGTDGWEERIRDKMKNVRRIKRTKESPSGSATRKRGPPPTVFATVNKKREATREYVVEAADLNPFVAVIGDPESPKCCHIVAEKTILFDTPHVISAASSLFGVLYACNMEYPKTMCESFIFIQKFCMKLSDKLKTPRKVLSYVEKIRM
ncbi:hypothetical protein HOLleu_40860 [Holothuria leucospilota]|uniref:Uncharacterized protein n=1 Tax=Holothuria leucospilota TaxID=206669 RepID=A0A9Q0YGN1_HOLLE|nr:hypothetical protein HOLleu_40860 [Holothuria leucospilota]